MPPSSRLRLPDLQLTNLQTPNLPTPNLPTPSLQALSIQTPSLQTITQLVGRQRWRIGLVHERPQNMLLWITQGAGHVLLDGQRHVLGAHTAVFVPARSLFSAQLEPDSVGIAVHLPEALPLRMPGMPRHLYITEAAVQNELSALLSLATREQTQNRPLCHDALEAHMALVSVWLRRQLAHEAHVPHPRCAGARLSQRFCQLVPHRFQSGQNVTDYASALGVTPTHLARSVKAATGKTASDILTQRLLHAARSLLADTQAPAYSIARHLGFGSAAYFTRFIQQHTGRSPSQLRPQQKCASSPVRHHARIADTPQIRRRVSQKGADRPLAGIDHQGNLVPDR